MQTRAGKNSWDSLYALIKERHIANTMQLVHMPVSVGREYGTYL